mgnify:CR=1 FL=1
MARETELVSTGFGNELVSECSDGPEKARLHYSLNCRRLDRSGHLFSVCESRLQPGEGSGMRPYSPKNRCSTPMVFRSHTTKYGLVATVWEVPSSYQLLAWLLRFDVWWSHENSWTCGTHFDQVIYFEMGCIGCLVEKSHLNCDHFTVSLKIKKKAVISHWSRLDQK